MSIVAITAVKNEEDIIDSFVRHNAAHVSCFLICDHDSIDSTYEILTRLQREGFPILLYRVKSEVWHQGRWITFLAHEAKAVAPDMSYLVPLDADEFIFAPRGQLGSTLDSHFLEHRAPVGLMPWVTHVPTPDDDPLEDNPVRRINHRFLTEPAQICKIVIPAKVISFLFNVNFGAHAASYFRHKLKARLINDASICHFPVRSGDQIRRKMQGSDGLKQIQDRKPDRGGHWTQLSDTIASDSNVLDNLEYIARRYYGTDVHNDAAVTVSEFKYLGDVSPSESAKLPAIRKPRTSLRLLWAGIERAFGKILPARNF